MESSDIIQDTATERNRGSNEVMSCPECDEPVHDEQGETYCPGCGLVVDEHHLDHGPEWRVFDADERRRTGAPLTEMRHDRGLSTEIGRKVDGHGRTLPGSKQQQLHRLRRQHSRARWRSKAEKNLFYGLLEVRRLASRLELADVTVERGCAIFREAHEEGLCRGLSIESIAAASVFAACRCLGRPIIFDEIPEQSTKEAANIRTAYQKLNRELPLKTQPMTPRMYVPRFASELGVSDGIQQRALEMAEHLENMDVVNGSTPTGAAAACLYQAGRENGATLTQTEAASVAEVTPITLRKHLEHLKPT